MTETALSLMAAEPGDWPEVERLLESAGLPLSGVRENLAHFVVARRAARLIGAAGLEIHGAQGLLRSVVVAPEARGAGLGGRLTDAVIARARELRLAGLTLLTETAADYFPRYGFAVITRAEAPADVQQSVEFQGACPQSAVVMHLPLGQ